MKKYIDSLGKRYATKKFDSSKKLTQEQVDELKEVINLTATSYGLQLFKVLVITDPEVRKQLKEVSWGQTQITDASHLFLFCAQTSVADSDIDGFVDRTAKARNLDKSSLEVYASMMKQNVVALPQAAQQAWTSKQTYIALGNLLSACAAEGIDACPMEGFDANKYNEILGLTEKGLAVTVLAAVGVRAADDAYQSLAKVRKTHAELFINI
jgi:nitroreductase